MSDRIAQARWTRWLVTGAAGLAALALLHTWTPGDDPAFTTCALRRVFGLPCPTCGLTRAFAALAHGDWARAIALHPLAPLLGAELAAAWALWGVANARGRWPLARRTTLGVLVATGVLLAGVWVMRLATGTLPA